MSDTSMAPDLEMDEEAMPGVEAAPDPGREKVFSAERFDDRLQKRMAIQDEAMAREVFGADRSKEERAVRFARQYGLDPSQVTPNLDEFEIRDLAERFGAAPPKLREFIGSDRANALMGYGDFENLSATVAGLQDLVEVGKGIPAGAGQFARGALVAGAVGEAATERNILSVFDRIDSGGTPTREEMQGLGPVRQYFQTRDPELRAALRTQIERDAPVPITGRGLFEAGTAVAAASNVMPAAPGYEDSIGRQLGEGLGTMAGGIALSAVGGPAVSGLAFMASGSGEAALRAIDSGEATEDQIIAAARLGIIPGLTDSLPIEMLLGRVPIPGGKFLGRLLKVPANQWGAAIRGIGRIGRQGFIEGIQEGGQAFLQNLIAREVYKPDQSLTEGLPGDAGLGAGVGGLAQTVKEGIGLIGGRRRSGALPALREAAEIDRDTGQAQTAQTQAQSLAAVAERVQASPALQSDPERLKALIGQVAGESGTVYLPAEELTRLYQDGKITDETLKGWGVLNQLSEVRQTGGDLVIPMSEFLTAGMPKEALAEVTQSVRLSASSMTARESEAFLSERQARVEALVERMAAQSEDRPAGAFAYDTIYNALVAAGRPVSDAKAYAALTADRYIRRAADRSGGDPDALFVRDNFRVLGPGMASGVRKVVRDEMDVVIARLQSGRTVKTPKTPVLDLLKARGGVAPGSPLAGELTAMGITAKSNPGLFKAGGLAAADNIVASEESLLTDNGIAVDANGYASPDALMGAIREEVAGRPWQTQEERDRIARLDAPVADIEKIMDRAGFDWRTAPASAIREFLETQLQPERVIEGQAEAEFDQPFGGSETATTPLGDAATIEVDGVERPALNSDGKPIHWSVEGVRNFWRWFGDSKVVDAEGRPLVVYHGTGSDTSRNNFRFKESVIGSANDGGFYGRGFYFAASRGEAEYYGPNVVSAYVAFSKPLDLSNNTGDLTFLGHFLSWAPKAQEVGALDPRYTQALESARALIAYVEKNVRYLAFSGEGGREGVMAKVTNPAPGYERDEISVFPSRIVWLDTKEKALESLIHKMTSEMGRFHSDIFPGLSDAETSLSDYVRVGMDGGSERLTAAIKAAGYDSVIYGDEYVAFSPTQIKSATGNRGTFDPNDARILYQPDGGGFKRGDFTRIRDPYGDIANIIRLTENADRSTFLHESGHFWLFQLIGDAFDPDPAMLPGAVERLRSDLQTTLDFLGLKVDVNASNPDAILSKITTDMHEKWARATEAYFMEGKAPSSEMRALFAKFSGWLISIYRKLRALDVKLTDDVRGVFDRLLATEEAIEEARDHRMYAVPSDLAESLTAAERANIEKLAEQAILEARIDLQGKVAREIQREKAAEWKAEKKSVTAEIALSVRRQPMYAALNLIKSATNAEGAQILNEDGTPRSFKLDRKDWVDRYGEDIARLMPGGVWAKRGEISIPADTMAAIAGFDSADALKLALMNAKAAPEKAAIREAVDAEMKRRHGDLMANIDDEAAVAVANDKQLELMALQARYIRRLAGRKMEQAARRQGTQEGAAPLDEARGAVADASTMVDAVERTGAPAESAASAQVGEELARTALAAQASQRAAQRAGVAQTERIQPVPYDIGVVKEAAALFVQGKKVRDLGTPERYENQASRLSRQIEKAVAGRDYAKAQTLMEQRLFNLHLAREVRKAKATVEKTREYLAKFDERKTREAMGKAGADYLERIDALLEQYEFRRATNRDLNRRDALRDWLAAQEELGLSPEIPAEVMARAKAINYREVPFSELLALRDAVKSIEHVARFKNKLLRAKEKRDLQAVVDDGVSTIASNLPPLPPVINPQRDDFKSRWSETLTDYFALVKKARTYFAAMDGVDGGGFFDRAILTPIRNGEIAALKRKDVEGSKVRAIIEAHYGKKPKWASNRSAVFIPEIGASLTLEERLAVALNWGNEGNRSALLDDKQRQWTDAQVAAILETLEKRDWDFVQATWDYLDSFWPEIAEIQRQRTGLAPERVERAKVQTKFGEYAGGYYPLKYDSDMSPRTAENDINEEFKAMNAGRYASAATKRGHTKERVGSGGQSPMLSLSVIPRHVNQVVTDIELGPAISDAWKVLNHREMQEAIAGHMGVNVTRQLDTWIKDVAAGQIQTGDAISKMFRGLRTSVSAGAMGWKLSTSLIQLTGYSQTVVQIGKKHAILGMAKYVSNPVKASREVRAISPFMDMRTRTFQRDVADALTQARGVGGIKGNVLAALFWPIAKMQQTVDIPTWLGAYSRAIGEGKTGDDAVAFADGAVEASQSSSLMSNLSSVERGTLSQGTRLSETVKLWTTFYSYFNTKLNLAMRQTQATNFRSPRQVAELTGDYLMLFWVEAVLGEMILDFLPNAFGGDDDDDDEDRTFMQGLGYHLALTAQSAAGTLPGLREISAGLQGFDVGPGPTRGLGDIAKGFQQTGKAIGAAFDEDEDVNGFALIRALIAAGNVISPIKYPASQINVAIRATEKADKGDDVTMIDYLISRPK